MHVAQPYIFHECKNIISIVTCRKYRAFRRIFFPNVLWNTQNSIINILESRTNPTNYNTRHKNDCVQIINETICLPTYYTTSARKRQRPKLKTKKKMKTKKNAKTESQSVANVK